MPPSLVFQVNLLIFLYFPKAIITIFSGRSMGASLRIAIVGLGSWGKNYLRVLSGLPEVEVKWICARREDTLNAALVAVPLASPPQTTTAYTDLLNDSSLQAIAIVTPAATHYPLVKAALLAGKDVLVEKPFTLSLAEAEELITLAKEGKRILMVGHIHCFNPAIAKIRTDLAAGTFGTFTEISSAQLHNDGKRIDAGALWDMFPHPLSILDELIVEPPREVSASGDATRVTAVLQYPHHLRVTLIGDWAAAEKAFRITLTGKRSVLFDDYAAEKLTYDGVAQRMVGESPLIAELRHFISCVHKRSEPRTGGAQALRVMRILDAAARSLNRGVPILLTTEKS